MDEFEKKYGIEEGEKIRDFHRSRRMFYIYQDKLFIAELNLPYSHAVWFEKEGLISREKDELFNEITRGIIDSKGDIYFYAGYDFRINKEAEFAFFSHLEELVKELELKPDAKIFGGMIKQEAGKLYPPRKEYGKIEDNL
ncbi:MAG: hypothetical protein Q8N63_04390 [Nanoarchaeota archaeon]|nr:hypothetical protein [Nanoarchaeota archaeon]